MFAFNSAKCLREVSDDPKLFCKITLFTTHQTAIQLFFFLLHAVDCFFCFFKGSLQEAHLEPITGAAARLHRVSQRAAAFLARTLYTRKPGNKAATKALKKTKKCVAHTCGLSLHNKAGTTKGCVYWGGVAAWTIREFPVSFLSDVWCDDNLWLSSSPSQDSVAAQTNNDKCTPLDANTHLEITTNWNTKSTILITCSMGGSVFIRVCSLSGCWACCSTGASSCSLFCFSAKTATPNGVTVLLTSTLPLTSSL